MYHKITIKKPKMLILCILKPRLGYRSLQSTWDRLESQQAQTRCTSPYHWSPSLSRCLAEGYADGDERRPVGPCGVRTTLLRLPDLVYVNRNDIPVAEYRYRLH